MKTSLFYFASIAALFLLFLSCQKEIGFGNSQPPNGNPPGGNSPASFTLQGAPGACMNDTIIGNYIKGAILDTGSYVKIAVNVTVAGPYTISTNTVNGY